MSATRLKRRQLVVPKRTEELRTEEVEVEAPIVIPPPRQSSRASLTEALPERQPEPPAPGLSWFRSIAGLAIGAGAEHTNLTQWRPDGPAWTAMLADVSALAPETDLRLHQADITCLGTTRTVYFVTSLADIDGLKRDFQAWFTNRRPPGREPALSSTHWPRKFFGNDGEYGRWWPEEVANLPENAWWSPEDGVAWCLDPVVAKQLRDLFLEPFQP